MTTLNQNNRLGELLKRRHAESEAEIYENARSQFKGDDTEFQALAAQYGDLAPEKKGLLLKEHGISVQAPDLSLAISAEMGEFLFNLTLLKRPESILELGSSNGVSTFYFAEALRLNGGGRIVATELEADKCASLQRDAEVLGLSEYIVLHEGDVFETVQRLQGSFDMVFIDIWASGYLSVFKEIEHLLVPGSVILADNMYTAFEEVRPFLDYLNDHSRYSATTLAFESGVAFAVVQ